MYTSVHLGDDIELCTRPYYSDILCIQNLLQSASFMPSGLGYRLYIRFCRSKNSFHT